MRDFAGPGCVRAEGYVFSFLYSKFCLTSCFFSFFFLFVYKLFFLDSALELGENDFLTFFFLHVFGSKLAPNFKLVTCCGRFSLFFLSFEDLEFMSN